MAARSKAAREVGMLDRTLGAAASCRRYLWLPFLGALLMTPGQWAKAETGDAGASRTELDAPVVQPLPVFVEPVLPSADGASLARLDLLIDQLLAPGSKTRADAAALVPEVDAAWLPAVAERFERVATTANKAALELLLRNIKKRSRPAPLAAGAKPSPAPALLELIVAHPDRTSASLRALTEVAAYSRMFEAIGSSAAARRLLSVYVRFGEFLRVDTELALARLGEGSIAALIEATAHPTPRIAEWAKAQLEAMGKHVASEAMQVQDATRRADILRAYGKTRDVETARLLIAFAASESAPVRLAAREAVAMLGEPGLWQLRDAYRRAAGASPPDAWPWRRVAEELFAVFDRQRLAGIYTLFNQGRDAAERGDLAAAGAAFDRVLAWDPLFERGPAMAPVYLAIAEQQLDSDPAAAALSLRRAERLAREGRTHDRALSLRYTLDARALLARGIVDEVLVQRARELDPDNARAEALDRELVGRARDDRALFQRYVAAAAILGLGLAGLGVLGFRRPFRKQEVGKREGFS
jgi:hypothetical protein